MMVGLLVALTLVLGPRMNVGERTEGISTLQTEAQGSKVWLSESSDDVTNKLEQIEVKSVYQATTRAPRDGEDELIKAMAEDHKKQQPNPPEKGLTNIPAAYDGEDKLMQATMEEDQEQEISDIGSQKGKNLVSMLPGNHTVGGSFAFQGSKASRGISRWTNGEKPSTKELTGHCALDAEVTIYSGYWKQWLSDEYCKDWCDVGEKWKVKASKANGKLVLWCDFWNSNSGDPYKSRYDVVSWEGPGEQWQVFEGKNRDGKVAFWNQYWYDHTTKGWLSNGKTQPWLGPGEEWIVTTKDGKNACPSEGLISYMVFVWRYRRTWIDKESVCKTVGIETTLTNQQTTTFSKSVTNVLESKSEVGAEIEGFGGLKSSLTTRTEVAEGFSKAYASSFSQKKKEETQQCSTATSPYLVHWEWVAVSEFLPVAGKTIVDTGEWAFTTSRNLPPKCIPGYMQTDDYQVCAFNGYLPGFTTTTTPTTTPTTTATTTTPTTTTTTTTPTTTTTTTTPTTTVTTTTPTTTVTTPNQQCHDDDGYADKCPGWVKYCTDEHMKPWMRKMCSKTCGFCQ